ncbi:MAG: hypothetical protein ACRDJ9_29145 [Dehalococcoidia bacterium]
MSHGSLIDARVWRLLVEADRDFAAQARAAGCRCGGALHRARYRRKPRGGVPAELRGEYGWRESLCCAREGCRRRMTPSSLRFLGRRVYVAAVVVLVSAMTGGVTAKRAASMRELVGVDRRTLQRWRAWWLETFVRTAFWRAAGARLVPRIEEWRLPASLLERFIGERTADALVSCLRFLSPITTNAGCARVV